MLAMKKTIVIAALMILVTGLEVVAQGSNPGTPAPIPGIALAAAAAAGYGLKKARDARKNMEE